MVSDGAFTCIPCGKTFLWYMCKSHVPRSVIRVTFFKNGGFSAISVSRTYFVINESHIVRSVQP